MQARIEQLEATVARLETHARHAALIREAEASNAPLTIRTRVLDSRAVTEVTAYAADHPGLFSRIAGALAVAAWLVDGIRLTSATDESRFVTLLVVGLIFGVVNAFVRPVVMLLSLPFIILTLGFLLLVINAGMLLFTAWLADLFDVGFHVDGFWTALVGSIIITIVGWGVRVALPGD